MTEHSTTAGPALLAALLGPCPNCGNGHLRAVYDGQLTNLLCGGCRICWHAERTFVYRVDPIACAGCPLRNACLTADRNHLQATIVDLVPTPVQTPG